MKIDCILRDFKSVGSLVVKPVAKMLRLIE